MRYTLDGPPAKAIADEIKALNAQLAATEARALPDIPKGWLVAELSQNPLHGMWNCMLVNMSIKDENGYSAVAHTVEDETDALTPAQAIRNAISQIGE